MRFSVVAALSLTLLHSGALAQEARPIFEDFVPEPERLDFIDGERMERVYAGRTVRGVYRALQGSERALQTFVETMTEDGVADYSDARGERTGRWFRRGDRLCFEYSDAPGRQSCFYDYRYGDCLVGFSPDAVNPLTREPLHPGLWAAVMQYVPDDYTWPEDDGSDRAPFSCELPSV